jgi:hypothetical protein
MCITVFERGCWPLRALFDLHLTKPSEPHLCVQRLQCYWSAMYCPRHMRLIFVPEEFNASEVRYTVKGTCVSSSCPKYSKLLKYDVLWKARASHLRARSIQSYWSTMYCERHVRLIFVPEAFNASEVRWTVKGTCVSSLCAKSSTLAKYTSAMYSQSHLCLIFVPEHFYASEVRCAVKATFVSSLCPRTQRYRC